ncbi:MAG: 5-amino-6-(D-ribitylamino)uracil--L-tyrosine 4-hydroxyphenyl transferase CofH [Deltaproteobacteria bacterium]|nr:5-amino-6-(D-ribitylamino)uracil--L-tyrosine 4-hydroxyphenyl transferase CofH [Deltaproteobacteria bacterium]
MSLERLFTGVTPAVVDALDRALEGRELTAVDAELLLQAEGDDLHALTRAANLARRDDVGDDVSFVVCRNVNFTNVCYVGCSFCGFSRHREEGDAYDHPIETILAKCRDAVARGATEVCIQAGIDPRKEAEHYREILVAIKAEFPKIHIHAYSPEEIDFVQRKSGMPLEEIFRWFMDAGLGSMPGTAAEILDDELRQIISPNKLGRDRWVEIVKAAHSVGLRSSATCMYGHIEKPRHIAKHLELLRDLQKETGGFTEFVPLGFIHEKNTLFNHMGARAGSTASEDIRMIAVARLFLRPHIPNIQVSWVKMGPKLGAVCLDAGANDMGGTLMEESISRESGSEHGENFPAEHMRALIRSVGRTPIERSTTYEILGRFDDPEKDPLSLEPVTETELSGPARWREQGKNPAGRKAALSAGIAGGK